MATFDFTSPEGKTYSVDGPDGATKEQAFQMLQTHLGTSSPQDSAPQVGVGEDVAKSIGGGLVNTVAGAASVIPAISSIAHTAADKYLFNPLFNAISGPPKSTGDGSAQPFDLNKSALSGIRSASDPYDHQPQTGLGKLAKTGTEFAATMAGGPETMLSKALTRVVAPTLATEGAGALTEGTAAEPYARAGAGLLSSAGASKLANAFAERAAIKAATPSLADVKSDASNTYDALTSRNVAIPLPQSTLDNVADDIRTTLNNKGIRPSNAASIHNAVDEIRTPATAGAPDVADLVAARQSIKTLLGDPTANKAGAFVALGKIEKQIDAASPGTMAKLQEADQGWSAAKANEALDKRANRAELRAAGADSGMNLGNKIRQNVANLLLSNEAKYLSAETKADLERIVRGTAGQNIVRKAANLLGGGGGLGMLAGGAVGYEAGGFPAALAGAAAGHGLKIANNLSVARQAERVAQNIRSRSPLGQQTPVALPQTSNPAVQGLLSALIARQQATSGNR